MVAKGSTGNDRYCEMAFFEPYAALLAKKSTHSMQGDLKKPSARMTKKKDKIDCGF